MVEFVLLKKKMLFYKSVQKSFIIKFYIVLI